MTEKSIYLSSWALTEPDDIFYFYQPTWLNAWEAHMYERGLYGTRANGWGLKRFGVENDIYAPERIRNPQYMPYLEAMEQVTDSALQQMPTKERMKLMKSRTAFIYADSWGESGSFEKISSALHIATIDTLPKNLLKKFSITEPTCKIRGEKQAFVQALRMAQDYLAWDVFDNVVICAAYRAIPVLVFSEEDVGKPPKRLFPRRADEVNLS
ncbi:ATP-binding protein, partial [Escherichia coli]